jgi:uncharacterized protein YllA (UPF0747 family)
MGERVELLYRIVWPYVQEIISQVLEEKADLREATAESLAEIVCSKVEFTVRSMVKELNEKARDGELEELRRLVRENPELARKASKYVAKRLKWRVRKLIQAELERRNGSNFKVHKPEEGGKARCAGGGT